MVVVIMFLFGLVFGSFINALVWRLKHNKNWVNDRSMCPHCKHQLAAKDLLPVLSWLSLKGKCRYCHKKISIQYPLVELFTACIFAISFAFWPWQFSAEGWVLFVVWLANVVIMMALLVYDYKWMILPNVLVVWLSFGALLFASINAFNSSNPLQLLVALMAGVLLFSLFWILFQVSKGKWIGGGDVKMIFALGVFAGTPLAGILVIFIASLLGTIWAVPLMITKKYTPKTKIPFGPLLIIATIMVVLCGQTLIDWYKRKVLYL